MDLYRAAMRIGRDHIASTVDTLVLAYAGAAMPLLLLFTLASRPIAEVITGGLVAQEVVRTLVGSIGLVASVPLTTGLAALIAARHPAPRRRPGYRAGRPPRALSCHRPERGRGRGRGRRAQAGRLLQPGHLQAGGLERGQAFAQVADRGRGCRRRRRRRPGVLRPGVLRQAGGDVLQPPQLAVEGPSGRRGAPAAAGDDEQVGLEGHARGPGRRRQGDAGPGRWRPAVRATAATLRSRRCSRDDAVPGTSHHVGAALRSSGRIRSRRRSRHLPKAKPPIIEPKKMTQPATSASSTSSISKGYRRAGRSMSRAATRAGEPGSHNGCSRRVCWRR